MSVHVSEMISATTPDAAARPWYYALGASTLAHVGIVLALTAFSYSAGPRQEAAVDTHWTDTEEDEPLKTEPLDLLHNPETPSTLHAGGNRAAAALVAKPHPLLVDSPLSDEIASESTFDSLLASADLVEEVALRPVPQAGDSTGEGAGEGDGQGDGFFGITHTGTSFVYVVDCSLSMNHPHDSPAKTRFKRLKLELVKSIGLMEPTQQFFIIFFNQEVLPMPARSLQPASPEMKQRYLKWVTDVRTDGDTDPREAINLAVRLKPDVIYFLTDGAFDYRTTKELGKLKQDRVAIHTFALGNQEGEPILRQLAERNRGTYHYIP